MESTGYGALVLCYHAVSDEWAHPLAVTRRSFERQLRSLLWRGYRPLPAGELLRSPRRSLHVTFDDAFRNVHEAIPVLERLGIPATVFAVTSLAVTGGALSVPELAAETACNSRHLATMTWAELGELAERGLEIGSHTVTHPHLMSLSDADLDRELTDSRVRIEDELGRPCRLLAYPYGEHDARLQDAARRSGYEAAFALWAGAARANRYALRRIDVYRRDSLLRMTIKTSFLKPHATAILARARAAS